MIVLLFTVSVSKMSVSAESWGNNKWTFDWETGTLTIEKGIFNTSGMMKDDYPYPWHNQGLNWQIRHAIIGDGLTNISEEAFKDCGNLLDVSIPSSVTKIESGAFSGCISLTEITISDSVTIIESGAFYRCTGLESVTIGKKVEEIGAQAFAECVSLREVNFNSKTIHYKSGNENPEYLFRGANIFENAGTQGPGISVVFGDDAVIPSFLFYSTPDSQSPNVKSVVVGTKTNNTGIIHNDYGISPYAFYNCDSLESVIIPDGVDYIGAGSFSGCTMLNASIGGYPDIEGTGYEAAFKDVLNVSLPPTYFISSDEIGARAVNGYVDGYFVYSDESKTELVACSLAAQGTVVIPSGVEAISEGAFQDCAEITGVTIPESVTSIGENAFCGCDIQDVWYIGTEEAWNNLSNEANTGLPSNTEIHSHTEHEYSSSLTQPATCTENGIITFTCVCGNSYTEIVTAAHTPCEAVQENLISSTCTESGSYDSVIYCSVCGKEISRETIDTDPLGGHTFNQTEYIWNGFDSCTASRTCSVCEEAETCTGIINSEITREAGLGVYGEILYTAEFDAEWAENQETTQVIESIKMGSAAADKDIAVKGEYITWTVVTSKDVEYIKLTGRYTVDGVNKSSSVMYRNTTVSNNVKFTEDENTRTWVITQKSNYTGDVDSITQNYTVYYRVVGESAYNAYNEPITINVYATKEAIPATETYTEPFSVVSVTAPETITVGRYGTITVVTTSDCDKVRIGYNNGGKMKYVTYQTTTKNNVSYTDADGLRTWIINYKFATGESEYTVQGRGPVWSTENGKNFTVIVE